MGDQENVIKTPQSPQANPASDDTALDTKIGLLLQTGVFSSAAVVLLGGLLYVAQHGRERPDYQTFHGVPANLNTIHGIAAGVLHGNALAIIQLGLLMLIATPVARVVFSVFAFLAERDYLYVAISALVLAVLLYSLIAH
jgi:uncharacterized membrane protein